MTTISVVLAALGLCALLAWLYLLLFRSRFWLANQRLRRKVRELDDWPAVAVIVPARDEAAVVDRAIRSLLDQNYPGELAVILVELHTISGSGITAVRHLNCEH